jgi:hypothetical protein
MPNQEVFEVPPGMEIYRAILRVAEKVSTITKEYKSDLGYKIAGSEQVMAAVRPVLLEEKVIFFPIHCEMKHMLEVTTKSGRTMNRTIIRMEFRFLHCPSGTYFDIPIDGEGQDMGDKSIQKARTICQKYALRQTLMLEFGDADPDKESSDGQESAGNTNTKNPPAAKKAETKTAQVTDEAVEMASQEAYDIWLELVEQAKALKITYPDHVFPLPLTVLRKSYKSLDEAVKAAAPKESA